MILNRTHLWRIANILCFREFQFERPYWGTAEWRRLLLAIISPGSISDMSLPALTNQLAELSGMPYCHGLNHGRSGIELALRAYNFPRESEVIVPSFMCGVVGAAILQAGCRPVFVDINDDYNASLESISEAIVGTTRAIILAHLGGKWLKNTKLIAQLALSKGIKVVEDACQATGLQVDGQWVGTLGDVGVYSFGEGKLLYTIGGGAIVTRDSHVHDFFARASFLSRDRSGERRQLLSHIWRSGLFPNKPLLSAQRVLGKLQNPDFDLMHMISPAWFQALHISKLEATLALIQVKKLPEILARRRHNARQIHATTPLKHGLLHAASESDHAFCKLWVTLDDQLEQRDMHELLAILARYGIPYESPYVPLHLRQAFRDFRKVDLSRTEKIWSRTIALPVATHLSSSQMQRVAKALETWSAPRCR